MRQFLSIALVIVYVCAGAFLYMRAMACRLDPSRPIWAADLLHRDLFTPAGLLRRRTTLRFYLLGGVALAAGLWMLAA